MCRFRSGIILKTRCVIAQEENDSHSDLLESMGIEDTAENAMRVFVRAELLPPKNEWWTNPDTWKVNIDQDITPDWFDEDKERYITEFRAVVKAWWKDHVLIDQKVDELTSGYYRLKRCKVKELLNDVKVLCDNSTVSRMYDNSTVSRMYGNSTVSRMCDNSTVSEMCDNSTVSEMCDNSTVSRMYDNSTVSRMYGNSTVSEMYGDSTVSEMYGDSTVSRMYDNSTVSEMYGDSTVSRMYGNSIARNHHDGTIHISSDTLLKVVNHVNDERED